MTDPKTRIDSVLEDVDRSKRLVEDSRRKRLVYESRLRHSRRARPRHRGLFGWIISRS